MTEERSTPRRHSILARPGRFIVDVAIAFHKNQGFLLAGALAYYILLSIIPLLTFLLLTLSHLANERALMATLQRYLGMVVPSETEVILAQIRNVLEHREIASWVVLGSMLFFRSLAFGVAESALSIIFIHRVKRNPRPLLVSLLLPYLYIILIGAGLLVMTVVAGMLQSSGDNAVIVLGQRWIFDRASVAALYLFGLVGLVLVLASAYLVMPPREAHIAPRHALAGGIAVGVLWEATRHILLWYFSTLSLVGVVYGSLATTIVALLSLEVASIMFLLGAQVIAEYERLVEPELAGEVTHSR
jgi:membrane protein